MRGNSGIIGPETLPTANTASGTFDSFDVHRGKRGSIWPDPWKGITNGLSIRWDFNDTNCYPGSGSNIYNLVNTSSLWGQGVKSTNPTLDTSTFSSTVGSVMDFTSTLNSTDIELDWMFWPSTGDITISYWVYSTNSWGAYYNTHMMATPGSGWDFEVLVMDDGGTKKLKYSGTFGSALANNTWYNIILTMQDSTNGAQKAYLNGTLDISSTGSRPSNPKFYMGEYRSSSFGFTGYISGMLIYDRVLSQSEITETYNLDKARHGHS